MIQTLGVVLDTLLKLKDYYSIGILLIEMLTGTFPFEGYSRQRVMSITLSGEVPIPEKIPANLQLH